MDNWFSPETAAAFRWLSLLALLSALGPYSLTGRHRRLVLAVWIAVFCFGCLCLGAAAVALLVGQPAHVVRPFAVTGLVVTLVFGLSYRGLKLAYGDAELRRMAAQDIF